MNVGKYDQFREAMKDIAVVLMNHHKQMLKVGFTPDQALNLTMSFQRDMVTGSQKKQGE